MTISETKSTLGLAGLCLMLIALTPVSYAKDSGKSQVLWHDFPATDWQSHAFPIGNGTMGAMIFGGTASERVQFNVDSLWTGNENPKGKSNANRKSNLPVDAWRPC